MEMLRVDAWDEKKCVHASTLETGLMHGAERQELVHHFLEARAGGVDRGTPVGRRTGRQRKIRAGGSKGKDFGQWARVWNRRVARGAGLRYTRAKDLVQNRSTATGLALPDVGAQRTLFF